MSGETEQMNLEENTVTEQKNKQTKEYKNEKEADENKEEDTTNERNEEEANEKRTRKRIPREHGVT